MWTAITIFVLSIFGIYKNADGQYIDYKEKELQEFQQIYTNDCKHYIIQMEE